MTQHNNNGTNGKRLTGRTSGYDESVSEELLTFLCERVVEIDRKLDELAGCMSAPRTQRDYYSVSEFAKLTERSEYRVREWCRLQRINAEKCETGRGDAKSWRIPASELARYLDHGLLPAKYLP